MESARVIIPKVWRSELPLLIAFFLLSIVAWIGSKIFPITVIQGEILRLGDYSVVVAFPLLWFLPLWAQGQAMYRIQNVLYSLDSRGIEAKVGRLALNQRVVRVRFEDVRSVETEQTFVERLLDIGTVQISTASTGDIEVEFKGIAAPFEVRDLVERERDARIRIARRAAMERDRHKRPAESDGGEERSGAAEGERVSG